MVRGGSGDKLVRTGNRADVHLHVRAQVARGVVTMHRPEIYARPRS